jgi:hypothetical protein
VNRDHVPPESFLAKRLRRNNQIRLVTFPVHIICNTAYKHDEEYFVQTLIPFAKGSISGDALFAKAVADYHQGKNRPLVKTVLSQAVHKVGSIHLPAGRVALVLDRDRFERVVSKIVRGLYHEAGSILPEKLRWSGH